MINFKGTSESDWLSNPATRIKYIIKKLNKYNENKKGCPLLG